VELPPEVSPAPPDLAPEHLEPHAEILLRAGLTIEDAEIERLGAEREAGSGRIVHALVASGELGAARLRDLLLVDVVADHLDAANGDWRGASLSRVELRGCRFADVRFDHCHLEETDFNGTELTNVDLRGSDLRLGGNVAALRGAIIDTGQAIDLAPRMAASLGLQVIDR
jgi:uncharacterized protein YjbI with pentapeptide repeats